MRALLKAMKPKDWLVVAAGLAVVGGIEVFKPHAAAPPLPQMFGEAAHLLARPGITLLDDPDTPLNAEFAGGPYFGAFAEGEGGAYGWARGFATGAAAESAALDLCRRHGEGCRIVADILPQGVTFAPPDSLSFDQAQALRAVETRFGPRAFARASDGTWGTAEEDTLAAATSAAMEACNAGRTPDADRPLPPCEVIATWDDGLLPPTR